MRPTERVWTILCSVMTKSFCILKNGMKGYEKCVANDRLGAERWRAAIAGLSGLMMEVLPKSVAIVIQGEGSQDI